LIIILVRSMSPSNFLHDNLLREAACEWSGSRRRASNPDFLRQDVSGAVDGDGKNGYAEIHGHLKGAFLNGRIFPSPLRVPSGKIKRRFR